MNTSRTLSISVVTCLWLNPVLGQESSASLSQATTTADNPPRDYTAAKKAILACYEYNDRVVFYHEATSEEGQDN